VPGHRGGGIKVGLQRANLGFENESHFIDLAVVILGGRIR